MPRRTHRRPDIAEERQDEEFDEQENVCNEVPDCRPNAIHEHANCLNCLQDVGQPDCMRPDIQFNVGMSVNAIGSTEPYLAGYITKIDGEHIYVKFPYGRCHEYEYKYHKSKVKQFSTQIPNGKFEPIKLISSRSKQSQYQKIKLYEERLQKYINEQ